MSRHTGSYHTEWNELGLRICSYGADRRFNWKPPCFSAIAWSRNATFYHSICSYWIHRTELTHLGRRNEECFGSTLTFIVMLIYEGISQALLYLDHTNFFQNKALLPTSSSFLLGIMSATHWICAFSPVHAAHCLPRMSVPESFCGFFCVVPVSENYLIYEYFGLSCCLKAVHHSEINRLRNKEIQNLWIWFSATFFVNVTQLRYTFHYGQSTLSFGAVYKQVFQQTLLMKRHPKYASNLFWEKKRSMLSTAMVLK